MDVEHAAANHAAREVVKAASQLAYEAAALAQLYDSADAHGAGLAAAQASIQAAKRAFALEDESRARGAEEPDFGHMLRNARESLDDAAEAVSAARVAVDAAIALVGRGLTDIASERAGEG